MLSASAIAKNYAKSLFLASKKENSLEKTTAKLQEFKQNFDKNFIKELQNPVISKNELEKIFAEIAKKFDFSQIISNFFILVAKNRKFGLINQIIDEFENIVKLQKNILEVEIISAQNIEDSELKNLTQIIAKKYSNKEIETKIIIKPDILGGFQIKIGSKLIDASLQNQIVAIGKECLKAIN